MRYDSDGSGELDVLEMKKLIDSMKIVATTDDLKVIHVYHYSLES